MKSALVVVVSTRAAQGIYEDQTGPILVQWLRKLGFSTPEAYPLGCKGHSRHDD